MPRSPFERDFMTVRRRFLSAPVLALTPASGLAEGDRLSSEFALVRVARRAMATGFEIAIPCGSHFDPISAATDALDLIDELEDQLTVYRDHSEISRLNDNAKSDFCPVEKRLFDLLARCSIWTRETEGAFDVAVGSLIKSWGFHHRAGCIPSASERARAMSNSGFRHVALDSETQSVKYLRYGLELNLGAVGKGYALDRAAELLRDRWGVRSALLHAGGSSVYAMGHPPAEPRGWKIQLRHPTDPEKSLGTVWLRERGLGTSSDTFQYFEYKNRKYGHLLDPRTGWPSTASASASVVAPTAAEADAMSTAAFVLGVARTEQLTRLKPHLGIVVLTRPADESAASERRDPAQVFAWNLSSESYAAAV